MPNKAAKLRKQNKLRLNKKWAAEGRYLYYWERPAYDIKLGINYQFMGF